MNKIKFLQIIIFVSCLISFLSCEKDATDVTLPNYTPKLVIFSFISPSDSIITIKVTTTRNIYGLHVEPPANLPIKLLLIDGDKQIAFSNLDTSSNCTLKYNVQAGKEYTIKGTCVGYPDISATCHIPAYKTLNFSTDTSSSISRSYDGSYTYLKQLLKVNLHDVPNEINYYKISSNISFTNDTISNTYDLSIDKGTAINVELKYSSLMSDHLIDGQTITTVFPFWYDTTANYKSFVIRAVIFEVDADYYKYHTSLDNYTDSSDPFTEFSPVYSNINGGYGIFCSYMKYQKEFRIK